MKEIPAEEGRFLKGWEDESTEVREPGKASAPLIPALLQFSKLQRTCNRDGVNENSL